MTKSIAILGFPEVGKTTFLAALYAAAQSGNSGTMKVARLPEDSRYLDSAVLNLERLKRMPHTPAGGFKPIGIDLDFGGSDSYTLSMPDLSGEEFDSQWEKRLASEEVLDLYRRADALIVFVHTVVPPSATIQDIQTVTGQPPPRNDPDVATRYDPSTAPIPVKLTDIIQLVISRRPEFSRVRIAVVASAWDVELRTGDAARSPSEWFKQDLSLLWQYFESNRDAIEYEIFGVSAQGGDYEHDAELLEKKLPSDRVIVSAGGVTDNDISRPLRWAIGA